ncbi:MAG: tRNA pseudouridine(55) synthase TruB [Pontiellaceae bacterium]
MSRRNRQPDPFDGILLVDKPSGWTSHDVVAKVRGHFRLNKVGHGGTLDPMATGLLVLLIGRATKCSANIMDGDKTYSGTIRLGRTTSTQDIEGEILNESDPSAITKEQIKNALPALTGEIQQLPPMVSAIKKDGVALYKLARKGIEIERKTRAVHINQFNITHFKNPYADVVIECSKGTYIRTLAHDLGEALGSGGCLSALRRDASGPLHIDQAHKLDDILTETRETLVERTLNPAEFLP